MSNATSPATSPMPAIRLQGVEKHFDDVGAANGVTFDLYPGELLALLGPSGCGKTTTLRLIAGFERLDAGTIEIGDKLVSSQNVHLAPEKRRVGMVFQEYALFPHMSVAENIRFGLHAYTGDKDRRIDEVLTLVGLEGLGERMPSELSGGQQQRVALARALAPEPALILLDEPFSNLDAGLRVRVRAEIRAILKAAGATAVFVTHDQEEALSLVDKIAVLMDGRVVQIAAPQQLYHQPVNHAVAKFIGDANFLPGTADNYQAMCELGTVYLQYPASGEVEILIRPENIAVMPGPPDSSARVTETLFFGHDQLVTLRLPSGRTLNTRVGPMYNFAVGQPVQVDVKGLVMAYPVG
jgi:iron(III) transport system ATP-binding protein